MTFRKRFIISLAAIIILCWFGYFYFEEKLFFNNKDIRIKRLMRVARLIWLFFVGTMGFWAMLKADYKWMRFLWVLAYATVFLFLIVIGVVDWWIGPINENFRYFVSSVRLFFASPLPLGLFYFLHQKYAFLVKK